jgi:hypothetical protein
MTGAILVGGSLLSGCRGAAAQEAPRLRMEEVFARPLPAGFEVTGASVGGSGVLVLWARNQPYLLIDAGGRQEELRTPALLAPVAAALLDGDSVLEVVDARRGSLLRLSRGGEVRAERPLGVSFEMESAARTPGGWVVAGRDTAGAYQVAAVGGDAAPAVLYVRPAGSSLLERPFSAHLSAAGDEVLVTNHEPPFDVVRVSRSGAARPALVSGSLAEVEAAEGHAWVSLPLLPLDDGFVRTFSDLRSDTRLLVLYDAGGSRTRELRIDVPLGVLATAPERRLLVAARRAGALEVVGYTWRWDAPR